VILYQEFDEVIKIDNQDDKKVVTVKNDWSEYSINIEK
jgi:hypothetical protein